MKLYMEIQPEFTNRKVEEANKLQQQIIDAQNQGNGNALNADV